ncbi:hypothetical protein BXZ70DRAFT_1067332 [Cristinia sonorae]|uniref:Uncharacterized protein n=1 Tax=Cristinia sonorae TaxID=1940300 RepID=A0A8K0UHW4_9AGAR|nr:hypothetical protein BXZ70DRAFT_1067332 [Cristinia sonorae]
MDTVVRAAAGETADQVFADEAVINSAGLAFIAYGVHATLYFQCLSLLWQERIKSPRHTWLLIAYVSILFAIGSVGNGVNMFLNEDAFVIHRDYPGGPGQFEQDQYSLPYNAGGSVVSMIGFWLADGLLVFRFCAIFGTRWWARVVPITLYVASIILSIFLLHEVVSPGGTIWAPAGVNFSLAYWSTSIAINIILTFSIVIYLVYMRFSLRKAMGPGHTSPYLSISAMLVESAFLYTVFALAFLIPLSKNSNVNLIFLQAIPQIQLIAPLLIILRVAQGRAWTRVTAQLTLGDAMEGGAIQFMTMSGPSTTTALESVSVDLRHVGVTGTDTDTQDKSLQGSLRSTNNDAKDQESLVLSTLVIRRNSGAQYPVSPVGLTCSSPRVEQGQS